MSLTQKPAARIESKETKSFLRKNISDDAKKGCCARFNPIMMTNMPSSNNTIAFRFLYDDVRK